MGRHAIVPAGTLQFCGLTATLPLLRIDARVVARLHKKADAARWSVSEASFSQVLVASATKMFPNGSPPARELEKYLDGLHLPDLALACACVEGSDAAWEHFILEHRPLLYRCADALQPGGGARELADSLYADLYGLQERDGRRQSLFRYFHGRSSLATWLRAVLAQRHVDRIRVERRLEPLPDEEEHAAVRQNPPDPDNHGQMSLIGSALHQAVAALVPRDRLRLACYYHQQLTLAETGRILGEHEATVSRQLARTRRDLRAHIDRQLREGAGMTDAEIASCYASAIEDAGPIDLLEVLGPDRHGKKPDPERSI